MLTYQPALEKLLAAAQPVEEVRRVPLLAAAGRVLATAQQSSVSVPPLDNSAMEGYAVRTADVTAAGVCLPVSQHIAAGAEILPAGVKLRPQEIALAAAAGLPELPVYRRVRVGMFFTGDELVQPGEPLPPGAIYNSNRYALRTLLEGMGCEVRDLGAVEDTLDATRDALRRAAADNDLVITSGGVSVGEEDHVKPAVEAEGSLDLWKIAIKPGKPLAFGTVRKADGNAWFIGLPGNPVAAFVTCLMMVRPFVMRLQGIAQVAPRILNLPSASAWNKPDGARLEFLRGRINEAGAIDLYRNQGSAVATSLCWRDGLILNPPGNPIAAGDTVRFISFAELLA